MERLHEALKIYGNSEAYPFHMPGHKRNRKLLGDYFPVEEDITEITGFDNLHHPEGLIWEAERRAAKLFGAAETFFSINGSTAALLVAISATLPFGSKVLVARNCHKAVYHAIYLRQLQPVYLCPQQDVDTGILGGIIPEDVDNFLRTDPEIKGVVLTSPTYEGVVSDIRGIAAVTKRHGLPLVVDEAHGAHFPFSDYFPESAVSLGADLVIQSLHKTLPSLTQTALLHRCTDRVPADRLRRFLDIYETSSPSYLLMASLDACVHLLEEKKESLFSSYTEELEKARKCLSQRKGICLLTPQKGRKGIFDYDRSKLVFSVARTALSGPAFHDLLREREGIELEMEAPEYVIALTSVGDTREGFERLVRGVTCVDQEAERKPRRQKEAEKVLSLYEEQRQLMTLTQALDAPGKEISLMEAEGRPAGEYVMLYPPGIPLIVPGEEITASLIRKIKKCQMSGMDVLGLIKKDGSDLIRIAERNI